MFTKFRDGLILGLGFLLANIVVGFLGLLGLLGLITLTSHCSSFGG